MSDLARHPYEIALGIILSNLGGFVGQDSWPAFEGAAQATAEEVVDRAVAELRGLLWEQWKFNHSEHCGGDWPHPEGERCYWPLPSVLDALAEAAAENPHA